MYFVPIGVVPGRTVYYYNGRGRGVCVTILIVSVQGVPRVENEKKREAIVYREPSAVNTKIGYKDEDVQGRGDTSKRLSSPSPTVRPLTILLSLSLLSLLLCSYAPHPLTRARYTHTSGNRNIV